MAQPRISQLDTWARHERRVIQVLLIALQLLQGKSGLEASEIKLNRQLYYCLLEANRQQRLLGASLPSAPMEAKNPPQVEDQLRAPREDKFPDFQWGFIDDLEPDPARSARFFVIECKRLGQPERADWVFNSNYILHGVMRFITPEHGYAKGEKSAAMVGYVQSMDLSAIANEVNAAASAISIEELSTHFSGFHEHAVTQLKQTLNRTFGESPFTLQHYWVDLRHCYENSKSQSAILGKGRKSRLAGGRPIRRKPFEK